MSADSCSFWLVENGIPKNLENEVDGWVEPIREDINEEKIVDCLPWIVVEVPRNYGQFIKFHRQKKNENLPPIAFGIREEPISDRMGKIITYILIAPSRRQMYRLARLNLPHYMVLHKHLIEFIYRIHDWHAGTEPGEYNDVGINVHPSTVTHWPNVDAQVEYSDAICSSLDTFSRVKNFNGRNDVRDAVESELSVESELFDQLRELANVYYREKCPGGTKDNSRGNRGIDFGYTTTQATDQLRENRGVLDGLSFPSLTAFHTTQKTRSTETYKRAVDFMVALSGYVSSIEPQVYTHPPVPDELKNDKNCVTIQNFLSRIAKGNRFPSARFIVTKLSSVDGEFLIPHFDWKNCTHPKNSPVYGINEIFWCPQCNCWLRACLVVYGRDSITGSLLRYYRMYPLLRRCKAFVRKHKPHRIERGLRFIQHISEEVGKMNARDRGLGLFVMTPPHLDKMTFYDGIVHTILEVSSIRGFSQLYCISFFLCTLVSPNSHYMVSALRNSALVSEWWNSAKKGPRSPREQAMAFGHLLYLHLFSRVHSELPPMGGRNVHQGTNQGKMNRTEFRAKYDIIFNQWKYFQSNKYHNQEHKTTRSGIHKSATRLLRDFTTGKPNPTKKGKAVHVSGHLSCLHIIHLGAILQVFPLYFISWAIVPVDKTNETSKRLIEEYPGILGGGGKTSQINESFNLCTAIGHVAGGNANKGEQVCCKTLQYPEEVELDEEKCMEDYMLEDPPYKSKWGHNIYGIDGTLFDFFSRKEDLDAFMQREVQPDEYIQPLVKSRDHPEGKLWDFYLIRRNMAGELLKVDPILAADPITRWNPWRVQENSDHGSVLLHKKRVRILCEADNGNDSDCSNGRNPPSTKRKVIRCERAVRDDGGPLRNRKLILDTSDDDGTACLGMNVSEGSSDIDNATNGDDSFDNSHESHFEDDNSHQLLPDSGSGVECSLRRHQPIKLKRDLLLLLNRVLGCKYQELRTPTTTVRESRWGLANSNIPARLLGRGIDPTQSHVNYWNTSIIMASGREWVPDIGKCDCLPRSAEIGSSHVLNQQRFFLSREASRTYTILNALLSLCEQTTVIEFIRPILSDVKFPTSFLGGVPKKTTIYPPVHINFGIGNHKDSPDLVLVYTIPSKQSVQPMVTISCNHVHAFSKVYHLS